MSFDVLTASEQPWNPGLFLSLGCVVLPGLEALSAVWASLASESRAPVITPDRAVSTARILSAPAMCGSLIRAGRPSLWIPAHQFSLPRGVMCTAAAAVNSVWRKWGIKCPVVLCPHQAAMAKAGSAWGYPSFLIHSEWHTFHGMNGASSADPALSLRLLAVSPISDSFNDGPWDPKRLVFWLLK